VKFLVDRHGGRATDSWRVLLDTDDEAKARARYVRVSGVLRQGTVRLRIDGKVEASTSSPRLRSRW